MTVVPERLHAHRESVRRRAPMPAWTVPVGTALVIAVTLESVRRGLRTPSLVDDWFGIAYGREAFEAVRHLDYGAESVDVAGRYRPAYTGIWNYLQWHLLGRPSVAVAVGWGAVRASTFVLAVWLLARWTAQRTAPVAATLAAAAVCLTPGFAVDLVRHGPADPLMLTGLILGLAAIGVAARSLFAADERPRLGPAALLAVGYGLYLFGAYSKEASIAALAFTPFFLKWAAPTLRRQLRDSRRRGYGLAVLAALLVAPLIHISGHLALALARGENPYPTARFTLTTKILAAGVFPLAGAPGPLGTIFWIAVVPAAVAMAARALWRRERDAWLLAGLLTTGFLMSAFSLARGDTPSRYYLPWIVAVSAVAACGLARANSRLVACAAAVLIVAMAGTSTRTALATWKHTERSGAAAVALANSVVSAGCPLYLADFDVERRVAIPRLLPMAHPTPARRCSASSRRAFALDWVGGPLPTAFAHRCRDAWAEVRKSSGVSLYRCAVFRGGFFLDQDAASGAPSINVVRLRVPVNDRAPRTFTPPERSP